MDVTLKEDLLAVMERMPAFPQSVTKVLELSADINCEPKALVEVIEYDPVMTVKMLTLVNSAYFGLRSHVRSINHALVYLGMNTVKNMAMSIAAIGMMNKFDIGHLNTKSFLMHSVLVGVLARRIGELYPTEGIDDSDYFIAGLLHDFGKLVLIEYKQESYAHVLQKAKEEQLSLAQVEKDMLGANHAEVGGMLAEYWGLPEHLSLSLIDHHDMQESSALTQAVFMANQIAKFHSMAAGNVLIEPLSEVLLARFGSLESMLGALGDLNVEMEKTQAMINL